jgi:hypothetical protein
MQILRVFFSFIRSILAGLSSVVISYGKFLEVARSRKKPARKAHRYAKPPGVARKKVKKSTRPM